MSIRRRPGSPWFHHDFTVKGRRFRGSLETNDPELARIIEAKLRADILTQAATGRRPDLTLDAAFGRYWLEVAATQATADDTRRMTTRILGRLGKGVALSAIGDSLLAEYVGWRRGQKARRRSGLVSNATVNREIELLRRVLRRASDVWKVAVDMPAWSKHLLPEADERNVKLGAEAIARFLAAFRQDYVPLFAAAQASGIRLGNLIGLTWAQVDWQQGFVRIMVKSKKPGGRLVLIPIAGELAAILQGERGKHATRVFTYLVRRPFRDRHSGMAHKRGERLPFTQNGFRAELDRARKAAGLPGLRFHDLRHVFGNAFYQATGRNLKATQRAMGHASITSTLRYLSADIDDVRAGMDQMAENAEAPVAPASHKAKKT